MDDADDVAAIRQWVGDALTCASIEAVTTIHDQLIGDLDGWQPIGILSALDEGGTDVR